MSFDLTKDTLDRLFAGLFGNSAPRSYMMGVRGALPVDPGGSSLVLNDNEVGLNNDTLGIISSQGVKFYKGTLDAGDTPGIVRRYRRTGGVFHIGDGLQDAYKGPHCPPSGCYPAFRIRDAKGWRDRDVNGHFDSSDAAGVIVPDHINIHRGARGNIIGINSEGCANVISGQWPTFKKLGYDLLPQNFTFWVIAGALLRDAYHTRTTITLVLNGHSLGAEVSGWLSNTEPERGRTLVPARPLLARLLLDGQPPQFQYQPDPPRLVFPSLPQNPSVPLTLVAQQGVAGLREMIETLDPKAVLTPDLDSRRVLIQSKKLTLQAPDPKRYAFHYVKDGKETVVSFDEVTA